MNFLKLDALNLEIGLISLEIHLLNLEIVEINLVQAKGMHNIICGSDQIMPRKSQII